MGNLLDELQNIVTGDGDAPGPVYRSQSASSTDDGLWDKLVNAPVTGYAHLSKAEAGELVRLVTDLRRAIYYNASACTHKQHEEMLADPGKTIEFAVELFKKKK